MVTVEQATTLAKAVEALALPHEAEILADAEGFFFCNKGVVKAEHVEIAEALYTFTQECCFYDDYEVFGEEVTEMCFHSHLVDEDEGEPVFTIHEVVRALFGVVCYKDQYTLWSVPRW